MDGPPERQDHGRMTDPRSDPKFLEGDEVLNPPLVDDVS